MEPMRSRKALLSALMLGGGVMLAAGQAVAEQLTLAFGVPGVVASVSAKPGQKLAQGDELARLDQSVFRADAAMTRAQLAAAQERAKQADAEAGRVKQLYDDLNTSAEELEKAQLAAVEAKAGLAVAQRDHARAQWRLKQSVLRAPLAGWAARVPGYVGLVTHPQAGAAPIVVIDVVKTMDDKSAK
ncbi:efflux RND transporter periplasmic adaptor subunit [Magnetofaba australis]|uniref:Putative RND multidrug efflux membrane fusion protein MexE n=1 Tax=Magnetofaba australis IT-1 TaxID=1434232 RepID=A0A1Y2K3F7_9PROT|nr:biotin/lipoyl-binding protein [Magnetofaba australis]OSM02533.1 putative RND multidrug efflux membrane fusion protein MexE [Magnetofaba australis IT-1]